MVDGGRGARKQGQDRKAATRYRRESRYKATEDRTPRGPSCTRVDSTTGLCEVLKQSRLDVAASVGRQGQATDKSVLSSEGEDDETKRRGVYLYPG